MKKLLFFIVFLISYYLVDAQNYVVYRKDTVGGTGVVQLVTKPYLDTHSGILTVYTTVPILGDGSSGNHVRADTSKAQRSLATYNDVLSKISKGDTVTHGANQYVTPTQNLLKQNKADTANNSVSGVMSPTDHQRLFTSLQKSTTTVTSPDSVWVIVDGQAQRSAVSTIPYGFSTQAYSSGTVYTLTNASALVDFGTTDPTITLSVAGTWKISGGVYIHYAGATFAANQTVTFKFRRTNNTAADLTNGTTPTITLNIVTTFTGGDMYIALPTVYYTTSNSNDVISIYGGLSVAPSAGSMTAIGAFVNAEQIY